MKLELHSTLNINMSNARHLSFDNLDPVQGPTADNIRHGHRQARKLLLKKKYF
jgi:hypothetical protein